MKYVSFLVGILLAPSVFAIESSSVLDRYSVVGVISGSSDTNKDVAVIKDRVQDRSLTVSVGTYLGKDKSLKVKDIIGKKVILSDGNNTIEIGYAHPKLRKAESVNPYNPSIISDDIKVEQFIEELSEAYESNMQEIEDHRGEVDVDISDYAFQLLQKQRLDKTKDLLKEQVISDSIDNDAEWVDEEIFQDDFEFTESEESYDPEEIEDPYDYD